MSASRYLPEYPPGLGKQIMIMKANKTSFTMANTGTNLEGWNFFSFSNYYSTLSTKLKQFIAASETLDELRLRWKASMSKEDAKIFMAARDDLKRVCADIERAFMVIFVFDKKDAPRFIKKNREVYTL